MAGRAGRWALMPRRLARSWWSKTSDVRSPKLFLSYAHRGTLLDPEGLFRDLQSRGYGVWWDRDALPRTTRHVVSMLESAIRGSDAVVLLLERAALGSAYVRIEWEQAIAS